MNKICGYSCEHNKGGVCQITMCDKQTTLTTTTQNYMQIIEGTTMYYEWYVKHLQQELQRKDNEVNNLKSSIADYQEAVGDYQDELKRKDNEIKQLREDIKNHIKIASEYKEQMIIKDNIIKSLTNYLESEINDYVEEGYNKSEIREKNLWMAGGYDEDKFILDKLNELKEEKNEKRN